MCILYTYFIFTADMEPRFRKLTYRSLVLTDNKDSRIYRTKTTKRAWSRAGLYCSEVATQQARHICWVSMRCSWAFIRSSPSSGWLKMCWAGYFVAMHKESASQLVWSDFKNHAMKMSFKEYMELFPEDWDAIRIKSNKKTSSTTQPSSNTHVYFRNLLAQTTSEVMVQSRTLLITWSHTVFMALSMQECTLISNLRNALGDYDLIKSEHKSP
jgi:hypothetical protein